MTLLVLPVVKTVSNISYIISDKHDVARRDVNQWHITLGSCRHICAEQSLKRDIKATTFLESSSARMRFQVIPRLTCAW